MQCATQKNRNLSISHHVTVMCGVAGAPPSPGWAAAAGWSASPTRSWTAASHWASAQAATTSLDQSVVNLVHAKLRESLAVRKRIASSIGLDGTFVPVLTSLFCSAFHLSKLTRDV